MRTPFCLRLLRNILVAPLLLSALLTWQSVAQLPSYDTPAYLQFSDPQYTVAPDQTNALITVVRTGEFREDVSVEYSTLDGTAIAGQDYTSMAGRILIPAGRGFATFLLPIVHDLQGPGSKLVQLRLSDPSTIGFITQTNASVMILNNAELPTVTGPRLSIQVQPPGQVILSWSTNAGPCLIEKSADTAGSAWTSLSATPQSLNGLFRVTDPVGATHYFYRLRLPQTSIVSNTSP
jgi:hypothetical protein